MILQRHVVNYFSHLSDNCIKGFEFFIFHGLISCKYVIYKDTPKTIFFLENIVLVNYSFINTQYVTKILTQIP